MENENMISAHECCIHYDIEMSFINYLDEYGLIETMWIEEKQFIRMEQLQQLEKFIRMHYELNINMEGIEAISHLLVRIEKMHDELTTLRNRMNFFSLPGDLFQEF